MTSELMGQVSGEIEDAVAAFREKLGKAADLEMLKRKELLSPAEVQALYGLKVPTLETWRCRGGGPDFVKLGKAGGLVTYRHDDIKRYVEEHRVKGRV